MHIHLKYTVPPFLTTEMEKESMLYGELLRKTQQLRRLQAVVSNSFSKESLIFCPHYIDWPHAYGGPMLIFQGTFSVTYSRQYSTAGWALCYINCSCRTGAILRFKLYIAHQVSIPVVVFCLVVNTVQNFGVSTFSLSSVNVCTQWLSKLLILTVRITGGRSSW